jgi:Tol biopolymer transport system component
MTGQPGSSIAVFAPVRLLSFAALALTVLPLALVACGSRTELTADPVLLARDAGTREADAGPCRGKPWLVFELSGSTSTSLYGMRADGSQGHVLPLAPNGGSASISVDGTQLFYVTVTNPADAGYQQALLVQDLSTGTTRTLVSGPYEEEAPNYTVLSYSALSPDGQTLAYTYGYDVRLVDIDGSNDRPLLQTSDDDIPVYGHPAFTSDSATVLYGIDSAFGSVRVDGTDMQTLVTQDGSGPEFPNVTVSPDGTSVASAIGCAAFDAGVSGATLRIYSLAALPASCASGRVVTMLNESSPSVSGGPNPAWGPSGLIAYGSGNDVYVVDPDGGVPRNMTRDLTADAGAAFDPIWAPACAPIP